MNRQKSISSQAASISACHTVLDWPSIVAALRRARHGPASRSAALRMIAARSSYDIARQAGAASLAALTAAWASRFVEFFSTPSTDCVLVRLHDLDLGSPAHHLAAADGGGQVDRAGAGLGELRLDGARSGLPGA